MGMFFDQPCDVVPVQPGVVEDQFDAGPGFNKTSHSSSCASAPHVAFICFLFFVSFLTGCVTTDFGAKINVLSVQDEIRLGNQMATEIEKKEKPLDNPAIQAYVADIGKRLARVATRQDVTYRFTVIDAPKTINAFALPGGHMYIYTGLMKLCQNEAELAGVMAHEMGHVAAQHHGRMMTRQLGIALITQAALGKNPGLLAELLSQYAGAGISARYSRSDEDEADTLGMEFLFRAGYNPSGMITFMEKMMNMELKTGKAHPLPIFASHPPTEQRALHLRALEEKYPPDMRETSPVYADRYKENVLNKLQ